jgi:hypothetical protein
MNWTSLIGLFAGPLGNMINSAIATGAGAIVAYSAAKGNPIGDISNVVALGALALSTLISGFAGTQGVQIPIINATPNNGVRVVDADAARKAGLPKADAPKS